MKLHTLPSISTRAKKRLGRGGGSGKGSHTVGRGTKGQRSRVGKPIPLWFEGGQLPMVKRVPYIRGKARFGSLSSKPQLLDIKKLEKLKGNAVTAEALAEQGFVKHADLPVKIVGKGKVERAYTMHGIQASAPARTAIEKAGGKFD